MRWSLLLLLALPGCSAFRGSRAVNMSPFAENTLALVSDLRLQVPQPVYLRPFLAEQSDAQAARAAGIKIRTLLRGIIFYSLQVSAINNANMSEAQKSRELSRYLREALHAPVREQGVQLRLTEAQLDSVLKNVASQETYLNALRAAEPIVDLVVDVSDQVIGAFEGHVQTARMQVSSALEQDFAPHRANYDGLRALEARAMRSYVLVSRARLTDTAAVRELREAEPALGLSARATADELTRADRDVTERLATIRSLREQLRPELELYSARALELDQIITGANAVARNVRGAIILWSRAHRNAAAGIALPPDIDVVNILKGGASKLPGM